MTSPPQCSAQLSGKCFLSTEIRGADVGGWWSPVDIYWTPDTGTFLAFRVPMSIWHRRYGEGLTPLDALRSLQGAYP